MALRCSSLTALGLHCCRRLTDASMAACALRLRHLSSLNISGCLSMSPAAVQVPAPHLAAHPVLFCPRTQAPYHGRPVVSDHAATCGMHAHVPRASCNLVQAVVDANIGLHTCRSLQRTVIGCVMCCCQRQGACIHAHVPS